LNNVDCVNISISTEFVPEDDSEVHSSNDVHSNIVPNHPTCQDSNFINSEGVSEPEYEVTSPLLNDHPSTSKQTDDLHIIKSGDFGKVVLLKACRSLTDDEKFFLLKHHFVPAQNYNFPSRYFSGNSRHFQQRWLSQFNGLVYSESENGGFCKYCVLFGMCGPTMKEFGILVNKPLTDFKRAIEKLSLPFHSSKGKKFHQDDYCADMFSVLSST